MMRVENIGFKGYLNGIENWTADAEFKPMPHNYRHRLNTPIILVNKIEDVQRRSYTTIVDTDGYDIERDMWSAGLRTRKVGELDFYNEISGFLHTNVKAGHKLYDACSGIECIPEDLEVKKIPPYHESRNSFPTCAGAIIIDSDFSVYLCYGWDRDEMNGGGSEVYYDWL